MVYRLARDQVTVNKEVLIPATLTKEEEAAPIRPKMNNNRSIIYNQNFYNPK